ncbi:MAG: hypothetical protein ACE5E8_11585, partial [Acidimicrobiia bacterium]
SNPCACFFHSVIEHGPDDIVSVCRCEPRYCETSRLERADIVVWEVHREKLGGSVATAIGAAPDWEEVDEAPFTYRVGTYTPLTGYDFPVYLTIRTQGSNFRQVITELVLGNDDPFILVALTSRHVDRSCSDLLARRNACFLAMADLLVLDEHSGLVPSPAADRPLERFRQKCGLPEVVDVAAPPDDEAYCRVITHEDDRVIGREAYQDLAATASEFDIYIDGVSHTARTRRDVNPSPTVSLSPGEFDIIAEYVESRKRIRPYRTKAGAECSSSTAAQKLFDRARRKVDIKSGQFDPRAFRLHKTVEAQMKAYEFSPPDGLRFCVLIPLQE